MNRAISTILSFALLFSISSPLIFSQQSIQKEFPPWISSPPKGYINFYFVGFSESSILEEAKLRAEENGKAKIRAQKSGNVVVEQRIVEQYVEETQSGKNPLYRVWVLINCPKPSDHQTSPPTKFDPVWRSAIVPGWGQYYKGETTKGIFIIGGEALLIPAGIILGNLKNNSEADALNSRTQSLRDYYNDQANTYNNISLACFIAAAAVYVYSIVDAVTTEGEKVYVYDVMEQKLAANQIVLPHQTRLLLMRIEF
jgi:hypothetical protein